MAVHEHRHDRRSPSFDLTSDPAREVLLQQGLIVDAHHADGHVSRLGKLERWTPTDATLQRSLVTPSMQRRLFPLGECWFLLRETVEFVGHIVGEIGSYRPCEFCCTTDQHERWTGRVARLTGRHNPAAIVKHEKGFELELRCG